MILIIKSAHVAFKMMLWRCVVWRWKYSRLCSSFKTVAVDPEHPQIRSLLRDLGGLDLSTVMARRKEHLLVPYYQLMTLEQLQQAEADTKQRAIAMLEPPPILPERTPCGELIDVDEKLAGATSHRMIFTETSQHKDNQLRSIVVRETTGVLRQATWEERDRMCQVFFPALGRKMWLPKALTDEILPSVLNNMLHLNVLDLVRVQCDPQSHDYHCVHKSVYEDIEKRGCYNLLRSTSYFGSMVWYLLTSSQPPRTYGLLKDMLQHEMLDDAVRLIQLFVLCFPESNVTLKLTPETTGINLVRDFCEQSDFHELILFIEPHKASLHS